MPLVLLFFSWKLWWFEKKNYPHFFEFIGQILSLCRHWNIVKFSFFRCEKFKPSVLWDFDDFRNTKRHCAHKIVTCRSVPVLKWWISYKVSRKDTQNSDFYVPKCRFDLSFKADPWLFLVLKLSIFGSKLRTISDMNMENVFSGQVDKCRQLNQKYYRWLRSLQFQNKKKSRIILDLKQKSTQRMGTQMTLM